MFRHAPDHYDAIELHSDARWEVACSFHLPDDVARGICARSYGEWPRPESSRPPHVRLHLSPWAVVYGLDGSPT